VEGDDHEFGPISITENDIIEFGKKSEPQVFHTDPVKAKKWVFHSRMVRILSLAGAH
jgi:hypothetical protein